MTVVIPTRNRRRFLAEVVASVLAQHGPLFEIVIVDDGSEDDTAAYLASLSDPRVRSIRASARGGRSVACNLGLADARGALVMFLDDDDLLWPNALATLVSALREQPQAVAAVGARWDWFTQEDYERRDAHPRRARTRFVFDELLFGWSAVSGQNLYRTQLVREIGGFRPELMRAQDRDLWLRIARHGPVALRPEIVMTYRWHRDQESHDHLRGLRERIARRAIRALPRRERRRALRIRKSTSWFDAAEDAIRDGRYADGAAATARSVAASPQLFISPIVGPLFVRRLLGRLWHRLRGR